MPHARAQQLLTYKCCPRESHFLAAQQLWVPRLPLAICRGQQASQTSRALLLDEPSLPAAEPGC